MIDGAQWNRLKETEGQPLLPWSDYDLTDLMEEACVTEEDAAELIRHFGATRSAAHALALCGALARFADGSGPQPRISFLFDFFRVCRLRCFYGLMISLLSKVNYLIQRDRQPVKEQEILVDLCLSGLEMCEQMSQDHWYEKRAEVPIELIELIVQHGVLPPNGNEPQHALLVSLLNRSKRMLLKVRTSGETGDVHDGRRGLKG